MTFVKIDPDSFRSFTENFAESDEVISRVENMTDTEIIDLVESNLDYNEITNVISEAENVSLSQLEME